ncbi:MAG TPA: bifunctional riboflavin kinase/FAD synthetase [Acidimicrobiales bacterium]|nr:bifunctional riboflavin kinase/FAD synthetase [Acidimicrobiales bacterium]HEU0172076.1 bifunctional riboflavin kinase/FAD synthetase [Acidimicrobiales bacterium]
MEVIRDLSGCPRPPGGTAVTIGAYDGVHLGHRAVIGEVRRRADEAGLRSAVVTFDRHPASVVRPESAPRLLTDLDQKLELLAATGIDYCLVVTFDEARSHEPADDFVREVLVGCLAARLVVVGDDFHFGHKRSGNVDLLRVMGADLGFEVDGLALVDAEGHPAPAEARVSSTRIRHALVEGDLALANAMLGRLHEVRGMVAHGDHRGRELGFPTANVSVPGDILLPADGIYAGWLERAGGDVLPAAISLGRRPTFYVEAHASLLEAHVLDFDGDLYGEHVKVRFDSWLRGEVRFGSVEALIEQMARDCGSARRVLGVLPRP